MLSNKSLYPPQQIFCRYHMSVSIRNIPAQAYFKITRSTPEKPRTELQLLISAESKSVRVGRVRNDRILDFKCVTAITQYCSVRFDCISLPLARILHQKFRFRLQKNPRR